MTLNRSLVLQKGLISILELLGKMAESPTLTDWLIQYVDKVKVIEPQSLKNSIIEKLEIGLQKYLE